MLGPSDAWRHAHETAHALRQALLQLGIPETELNTLTARSDTAGNPGVYVPHLSTSSAERLLAGIGPSLGPDGAHLARPRPTL